MIVNFSWLDTQSNFTYLKIMFNYFITMGGHWFNVKGTLTQTNYIKIHNKVYTSDNTSLNLGIISYQGKLKGWKTTLVSFNFTRENIRGFKVTKKMPCMALDSK